MDIPAPDVPDIPDDVPDEPDMYEPDDAPAPAQEQDDVPWGVMFPKRSVYRDAIVKQALPRLLILLRQSENRLVSPRDLVNKALNQCKDAGDHFWGAYDIYSRKRSVCDAILCHYFDILHDYVKGRQFVAL